MSLACGSLPPYSSYLVSLERQGIMNVSTSHVQLFCLNVILMDVLLPWQFLYLGQVHGQDANCCGYHVVLSCLRFVIALFLFFGLMQLKKY